MKNARRRTSFLIGTSICVLFWFSSGCGGGGGTGTTTTGGANPAASKTLTWTPPSTYTDTTPLNPVTDLTTFEIYVKETGPFTDNDSPVALVRAVDPASGQLTTSFDLGNLGSFLSHGIVYQVSLRAVALDGAKSDFSQATNFSL